MKYNHTNKTCKIVFERKTNHLQMMDVSMKIVRGSVYNRNFDLNFFFLFTNSLTQNERKLVRNTRYKASPNII